MILATDVYYYDNCAKAVGVLFNWEDKTAKKVITTYINQVEEYVSGEFYKRELPCIIDIINQININVIETIIIDGHIYINNKLDYGLGGKLYQALDSKVPIIGIAKKPFAKNKETVQKIYRGESEKPLHVSSIGMPLGNAVEKVNTLKGDYRIPTILKQLDIITKEKQL